MIPHLVPEIEGGYPERDGEEGEGGGEGEGLVLENSRSWIPKMCCPSTFFYMVEIQMEGRYKTFIILIPAVVSGKKLCCLMSEILPASQMELN